MSYSLPLSEKYIDEVNDHQWSHFSKHVSPSLQFLNKDWYSAWECNHLVRDHPHSQVEYLSLFDDQEQLQGTFPHVRHSKAGINILSNAGLYYPFRSILFSSESAADCSQMFVNTINNNHRNCIVRIGPAVEDDIAIRMIRDSFQQAGWNRYEIDRGNTLVIHLPDSVDEFRENLGKKFNKKMVRRKKGLSKLGAIEYHRYNNCSARVWSNVIEQCSTIEQRSWLADSDDAEMRILQNGRFWEQYLQSSDASKRVVVWIITLDDHPIAYSFGIDSGSRRYSFSGHYDKNYKKYGLGVLVDKCMFEDAVNCEINCIDMGTGEADYKTRWGALVDSRIVDYVYLPPSLLGKAAYAGLRARDKIRSNLHSFLS